MTRTTPTCLWNDSASVSELTYSIEHGAVGATCNPVIVVDVLRKEMKEWGPVLRRLVAEHPIATEDQLGWEMVEAVSKKAASLLLPIFAAGAGRDGRLSIQRIPRLYRDAQAMVTQAVHFSTLAPNMIVKIARHPGGDIGDRGAHLPRGKHQCDCELHGLPMHRGGGGRGEGPMSARG